MRSAWLGNNEAAVTQQTDAYTLKGKGREVGGERGQTPMRTAQQNAVRKYYEGGASK